jgi:hypothetical protein
MRDLVAAEALGGDPLRPYLHPQTLAARARLELEAGNRQRATSLFAQARSEAETSLLHELDVGRLEIGTWEDAGDASNLADAGAWLLEAARGQSPPLQALAMWALVRSDQLNGHLDRSGAQAALQVADDANDLTVTWRACSVAAAAAEGDGDFAEALALRRQAMGIIDLMAASLRDQALRKSFMARPDIEALTRAESSS